jgi:transposase InsO family protein
MTIYGTLIPMARGIANHSFLTDSLTKEGKKRLKIIGWYKSHGRNASLASRHFGLGRSTFSRWLKRYDKFGVLGLNERSRRPKRLRQPSLPPATVAEIVRLRQKYPAWSKYKIKAMLGRKGIAASASSVGRVLKKKKLIDRKKSRKRRRAALKPKARFPRGLSISCPGDMVQMDTKHVNGSGGSKLYQFTAIDVLSKRRVLRIYSSQSSRNGKLFLKECFESFPFTIKNIQTDNGAPFQKEFDRYCLDSHIPHYYTYPRSPKQNSYVEISHGADQREFYEQGNAYSMIGTMREKIREWEYVWNNVRPHAALQYLTPNEYLEKIKTNRIATRNIINLQT